LTVAAALLLISPSIGQQPKPAQPLGTLVLPEARPVNGRNAAEAARAREQAMLAAQAKALAAQCRPSLAAHLHRIRRTCSISDEVRGTLVSDSLELVTSAADLKNRANVKIQRIAPPAQAVSIVPTPREISAAAVLESSARRLPSGEADRIRSALAACDDYRKTAIVRNLVVRIDDVLSLSPKQQTEITDELSGRWNKSWDYTVEALDVDRVSLRLIPSDCVIPYVNERQREAWLAAVRLPQTVPSTPIRVSTAQISDIMVKEELDGAASQK
jgi:hypothetical protein